MAALPPRDSSSPSPGVVHVTLFRKRRFADVIQNLEIKTVSWLIWMGPKSNDRCPCKRHSEERDPVKTAAEMGGTRPQAKDTDSHQSWRGRKDPPQSLWGPHLASAAAREPTPPHFQTRKEREVICTPVSLQNHGSQTHALRSATPAPR